MKQPESASNAADQAQDHLHAATDQAKNLYGEAADKTKDLYNEAADKSKELLDKAPDSIKQASSKVVDGFNKLSTTQKLVGGALIALGITYLAGGKKRKGRKAARALDELLLFVNDRIEGYKRAVAESKDEQLKAYYQQLVSQSKQFSASLNTYLTRKGGKEERRTTTKGKIYRKFMDAAAAITGRDEKAILAANVHGETWAMKAYKKALRGNKLKGEIRETVKRQFEQSKQTYERLKDLAAKQQ